MIIKLANDSFMAIGAVTRDAQMRTVGEKQTPVTSFSLACGKRQDTTTIFVECKAWRDLGKYAASLRKGDNVCAIGKIEEREYNGKTYTDLVCEWLWGAVPRGSSVAAPAKPVPAWPSQMAQSGFGDLMDVDDVGKLPF